MADNNSTPIRTTKALTLREQVAAELATERNEKAKVALKQKLRNLDTAKAVVANLEREINDLEASIDDGSFVG